MVGFVVSRVLLVVFNTCLFVFGIVLLVFGLTALMNNYTVVNYAEPNYVHALHVVNLQDVIGYVTIFMVTAGSISLIFSIIGCFAAAVFSRYILMLYWIILLLLILFEISVIIYVTIYPEKRKAEITKKTYESLKHHFKPVSELKGLTWKDLENIRRADPVSDSWLLMEIRFSCCGANNYLDYQTFFWNNITQFSGKQVSASVPVQCCKKLNHDRLENTTSITRCLAAEPKHINSEGCHEVVMSAVRAFDNYATGMVATGIAIQVVLLSTAVHLWSMNP